MDARLVGQVLIGVACALFVAGAAGLLLGVVGVEASMPLGGVALGCLVGGGILARRRQS